MRQELKLKRTLMKFESLARVVHQRHDHPPRVRRVTIQQQRPRCVASLGLVQLRILVARAVAHVVPLEERVGACDKRPPGVVYARFGNVQLHSAIEQLRPGFSRAAPFLVITCGELGRRVGARLCENDQWRNPTGGQPGGQRVARWVKLPRLPERDQRLPVRPRQGSVYLPERRGRRHLRFDQTRLPFRQGELHENRSL